MIEIVDRGDVRILYYESSRTFRGWLRLVTQRLRPPLTGAVDRLHYFVPPRPRFHRINESSRPPPRLLMTPKGSHHDSSPSRKSIRCRVHRTSEVSPTCHRDSGTTYAAGYLAFGATIPAAISELITGERLPSGLDRGHSKRPGVHLRRDRYQLSLRGPSSVGARSGHAVSGREPHQDDYRDGDPQARSGRSDWPQRLRWAIWATRWARRSRAATRPTEVRSRSRSILS